MSWDQIPDSTQQAVPKQASKGGWDAIPDASTAQQPQADWQANLKDFRLANGTTSKLREDNAVYLDASQNGQQRGYQDPGWYQWDRGATQWVKTSDAPAEPGWMKRNIGQPLANLGHDIQQGVSKVADAAVGEPVAYVADKLGAKHWADEQRAGFQARRKAMAKDAETGGLATKVNQFVGEAIPVTFAAMLGQPEVAGGSLAPAFQGAVAPVEAAAANTFGARVGANALTSMPIAGVMTPGDARDRMRAAIVAGLATPVAQGATEAIPAILRGKNPFAQLLGTDAERQAALARAQQIRTSTGAEPSLGEALQNPGLQSVENASEHVPFSGRKAQLERNNEALKGALKKEVNATAPYLGGMGAGPEVASSAERALAARKADIKPQYDFVRGVVKNAPTVRDNGLKAFDEAIQKESTLSGADSPAVKALKADRDKYASGEIGGSFDALEGFQDRLQSRAENGKFASDQTVQDVSRYNRAIGKAVGEDMHATVAQADPSGFASEVYKNANSRWQKEVIPYDPNASGDWQDSALKAANRTLHGKDGFEGTGITKMLNQDNPEMAKHAFESLDDQGRNAIKAEIWRRIDETAANSKVGFSPAKARSAIDDHASYIKQFFNEAEQSRVKGLQNAFQTMERSGQYLEQLANGKFMMTAGAKLMSNPLSEALQVVTVSPGARLYNTLSGSQAGKEWLLAMSKAKPGMGEAQFLLRKLPSVLGAANETAGPTNITPLIPRGSVTPANVAQEDSSTPIAQK